ncbi:MAG: hypothetical protein ACK53K_03920 [Burkholderiales bacterium]
MKTPLGKLERIPLRKAWAHDGESRAAHDRCVPTQGQGVGLISRCSGPA